MPLPPPTTTTRKKEEKGLPFAFPCSAAVLVFGQGREGGKGGGREAKFPFPLPPPTATTSTRGELVQEREEVGRWRKGREFDNVPVKTQRKIRSFTN